MKPTGAPALPRAGEFIPRTRTRTEVRGSGGWIRIAAAVLSSITCLTAAPGCSEVFWRPDLGGALQLAAERNCLVLVAYWSPFNGECIRMEREVFSNEDVQATLRQVIPVRVSALLDRQFGRTYGVHRVPAFVALGPDGRVLRVAEGYMNEGRFRGFIQAARLSF